MKLPRFLCRALAAWHRRICAQRPPDFIIGTKDDPYLRRWYLIPRNKWCGIYLHEILRDDEDRALHDHKMVNVSLVVEGGYTEVEPVDRATYQQDIHDVKSSIYEKETWRETGTVRFRLPSWPHRLVLKKSYRTVNDAIAVEPIPARSIFLMGPYVREWGFYCPRGWRRWQEFVNMGAQGEVGPGCD